MPDGLREAHVHLEELGAELGAINLDSCRSCEECLDRIARRATEVPPGAWVLAVRARVEGWAERAWPTAAQLHEAAGGRPCAVKSFDIHSLVASDEALRVIGIEPGRPVDGRDARPTDSGADLDLIDLDESGVPTGLLLEAMAQRVLDAIPAPTADERLEQVRLACEDLARRGFVEAHDMWSRPTLWRDLADLHDAGRLPIRVLVHPVREDFDRAVAERDMFEREGVRLGGLKVFTDGTLNSRTAWMLEPYADPRPEAPAGRRMMTDDEFIDALARAEAARLPLVAHAIGDAAVRRRLDLIERHGSRAVAHRIEHAEFIDPADVPRFAALNVIASVQPCHLLPDIEALRRLTPDRLDRVLPLRDLVDAAARAGRDPADLIWFGSDAPVVDPSPEDNLQAAVHRRRRGMDEAEAVAPEQALTEAEAWSFMRAPAGVEAP